MSPCTNGGTSMLCNSWQRNPLFFLDCADILLKWNIFLWIFCCFCWFLLCAVTMNDVFVQTSTCNFPTFEKLFSLSGSCKSLFSAHITRRSILVPLKKSACYKHIHHKCFLRHHYSLHSVPLLNCALKYNVTC